MPTRTPLPTFTATSVASSTTAVTPPTTTPIEGNTQPLTQTAILSDSAIAAPAAAATPVTAAPVSATLTIASDLVNVRSGPGTEYELVGSAATGESFAIMAKSAAGDWWQVCCVGGQNGWVFGELATVQNADTVAVANDVAPAPVAEATAVPAEVMVDAAPTATEALADAPAAEAAPTEVPAAPVAEAAPYDPSASAQAISTLMRNIRSSISRCWDWTRTTAAFANSSAQHLIFLTVLDQNGNGVDGAVVRNLVGDKSEVTTGSKGPGKAEITMYYEPFKLAVASDPVRSGDQPSVKPDGVNLPASA